MIYTYVVRIRVVWFAQAKQIDLDDGNGDGRINIFCSIVKKFFTHFKYIILTRRKWRWKWKWKSLTLTKYHEQKSQSKSANRLFL